MAHECGSAGKLKKLREPIGYMVLCDVLLNNRGVYLLNCVGNREQKSIGEEVCLNNSDCNCKNATQRLVAAIGGVPDIQ